MVCNKESQELCYKEFLLRQEENPVEEYLVTYEEQELTTLADVVSYRLQELEETTNHPSSQEK